MIMNVNVVCRTPDCVSNGKVSLLVDPPLLVGCGWCGLEITDKTEVIAPPANG